MNGIKKYILGSIANRKKYFVGYRKRIFICFGLMLVVVSVSLTLYGVISDRNILFDHLRSSGSYLVGNLARNSEIGVFSEYREYVKTPIAAIMHQKDVAWAAVYTINGTVLHEQTKKSIQMPDLDHELLTVMRTADRQSVIQHRTAVGPHSYLECFAPVFLHSTGVVPGVFERSPASVNKKEVIGIARVGLSLARPEQRTAEIIKTAGGLVALCFLLGLYALFLIGRKISVPLREAADSARQLGRGNLGTRIPVNSEDELGDLARSFNQMADDLQLNLKRLQASEENVRKRGEYLANLLDSASVVIIETDTQGTIQMFNRFAQAIFKCSQADAVGRSILDILESDRADGIGDIEQHIRSLPDGETVCTVKDGEHAIISWVVTEIHDAEARVTGYLLIGTDMTERKKIEDRLKQFEKLRALGEMAGGVAHDFNNLLAAILGRAQLIKSQIENSGDSCADSMRHCFLESIDVIERASVDGAETVKRIQEFARVRKDEQQFAVLNIEKIIENAIEYTKSRWKDTCESQGVKVIIKKEFERVPSIQGSPAELREVFTNMINNALDAMPGGGEIAFHTHCIDDMVRISVKDTGYGMPPEVQERMFDPFYTSKGPHSSGLGMSVSYGIISRHNGSITVRSKENEGTEFIICLPSSKEKEISDTGQAQEEVPASPGETGRKILVIEDEKYIRDILYDMLTAQGHDVTTASGGLDGLQYFEKNEYDMVFTDLSMEDMTGWDVIKAIKKKSDVSIALITGWGAQIDDREKQEHNVDIVINKPFSMTQIQQVICRFTEKNRPSPS